MQRTERELTDVEIIDAFEKILEIIITNSEHPVREDFQKSSRAAQDGYDIKRYLMDENILRTGARNQQEKLNL